MCCTITTPDDHELDTAGALVAWLTRHLGRHPQLVIHPAYRKGYAYDAKACLCPLDLEGTFLTNSIPFEATPNGDYRILAPAQKKSA
jgi:hypothetical protein